MNRPAVLFFGLAACRTGGVESDVQPTTPKSDRLPDARAPRAGLRAGGGRGRA